MVDEKLLASLTVATEAHTETLKGHGTDIQRLSGLVATAIAVMRRADAQTANGRLQHQAALNQILGAQQQMLGMLLTPEGLAGAATPELLDEARQIKRSTIRALTGRDRANNRRRDDEITLVRFPLLKGGAERRALRVNKRLAKLIFFVGGIALYWLAKKLGLPLEFIE